MRIVGNLLGLIALLVALAVGGLVGWGALVGLPIMQPLGQIWFTLHPGSLNLAQATIERGIWPPLWQSGVLPVLQQPAPYVALVAFGLALVLLLFARSGRKSDRKFG